MPSITARRRGIGARRVYKESSMHSRAIRLPGGPSISLAFALAALTSLPPLHAQPPQDEPPSFGVTSRLVEVSVAALDRKGSPVKGLRREQFTVLDNGKRREVAFFRYEGGPAAEPARRGTPPPGVFSNRVEFTGGPPRNITAIVLDSANTEPGDLLMVKAQAMQFLKQLAPRTRVAVYHLGQDLRVLHDFTDDSESLREQLRKFQGGAPSQRLTDIDVLANDFEQWLQVTGNSTFLEGAAMVAMAAESNFNTSVRAARVKAALQRLELIGRHIAGIPGRKNVVWISGGIAIFSARPSTMLSRMPNQQRTVNAAAGDDFEKPIRQAAQRLAQVGVVLYAVDARGLTSGAERLSETQDMPLVNGRFSEYQRAAEVSGDVRPALGTMAAITGGRLIFNSNDFSEGLRRAQNDLDGTYTVAFYADGPADGKWHPVKVQVDAPGVELTHRQGYLAEADSAPAWNDDQLRQALDNPLGSSAIHLTAHCARLGDGAVRLTLQVETNDLALPEQQGRRRGELQVVLGERSAGGEVRYQQANLRLDFTAAQYAAAREKGIPYWKTWKPAAETRALRVLVRDPATGQTGTLDIPLGQAAPTSR